MIGRDAHSGVFFVQSVQSIESIEIADIGIASGSESAGELWNSNSLDQHIRVYRRYLFLL